MTQHEYTVSSTLGISASDFWANATLADVNAELAPWVHMTAPAQWRRRPLREWPAGHELFKSWVLLFGLLPSDRHSFFLESVDPSGGFLEHSSSLTNAHWIHSRTVVPDGARCVVTDHVQFESRLPGVGLLMLPVYRAIFASRHRYLRKKYGGNPA